MENLTIEQIVTGLGVIYTALVYLLPKKYSSKISFIFDIVIKIGKELEQVKNSKGGLSLKSDGN